MIVLHKKGATKGLDIKNNTTVTSINFKCFIFLCSLLFQMSSDLTTLIAGHIPRSSTISFVSCLQTLTFALRESQK